jgi:hypothetical protein
LLDLSSAACTTSTNVPPDPHSTFAALQRHAVTNFSETPANRSCGRPPARTRPSFAISVSRVSRPSRPGSAFSSASSPRPPAARGRRPLRSEERATVVAQRHDKVRGSEHGEHGTGRQLPAEPLEILPEMVRQREPIGNVVDQNLVSLTRQDER